MWHYEWTNWEKGSKKLHDPYEHLRRVSTLEAQMKFLIGNGQPGQIQKLEKRQEKIEEKSQKMTYAICLIIITISTKITSEDIVSIIAMALK